MYEKFNVNVNKNLKNCKKSKKFYLDKRIKNTMFVRMDGLIWKQN